MSPDTRKSEPEMKIGTDVVRSAYNATRGPYRESYCRRVNQHIPRLTTHARKTTKDFRRASGPEDMCYTHHDPKGTTSAHNKRIPRPPILCREHLRRERVQHAIHDAACEDVPTVPC
jgi:hypothetical protein